MKFYNREKNENSGLESEGVVKGNKDVFWGGGDVL